MLPKSLMVVRMRLEVASGFEPLNRGFADLRLNRLATPPRSDYRGPPRLDQLPMPTPRAIDGQHPAR